ncbi:hypothetical protein [Mycobacterium mantenii]|uniref:hypothetical protein n=1 Tax=Mycobacterium mantenii TaxID=560555 RepID=UPI000A598E49|nr:hypothetical protein [Mycobacterium mantenii]
MDDGNRSLTLEEVRKTLARAEAARQAARTARERAARTVRRAHEIRRRAPEKQIAAHRE